MFTERFNELLSEVCKTSIGEFSKITGYDRSYVSHLRNGDRTPKSGHRAAQRLTHAICACAGEKRALDALREKVGAPRSAEENELCDAVEAWLFDGQSKPVAKKNAPPQASEQRRRRRSFGSRLELAMELANVSAMRLARSVNVDASLIVKYRSGLRVPQMNHPIIHSLAASLTARIYALRRTAGLALLVGAQPEDIAEESDGTRLLEAWLRDFSAVDTSVIEYFLEGMDTFSPEARTPLLAPEDAADEAVVNDRAETYEGVEGLRRAVLRFLGGAVKRGWEELWLYSDQNMDWMLGDREFAACWSSLMSAYVGGGGRIRIIHNVERGLEEMAAAIRSWLPLYLSGGIESWYSIRGGGERFSHTLFLAPGNACITGTCVSGRECDARYRYAVEQEELAHDRETFNALLSECRLLLRMSRGGSVDKLPSMIKDRDVHLVMRSISLGTMPEALLRGILRRASLPEETERSILSEWAGRRELLMEKIARGCVHECVALPERTALDAVPVDTLYAPLFYTPEEYGEHFRAVLELSEREEGYRVYALEEPPFERIRLITSNRLAVIEYLSGSPITFTATHPLMCRAFVDFAGRLEEHHSMDEGMLRERLLRYTDSRTTGNETPSTEEVSR